MTLLSLRLFHVFPHFLIAGIVLLTSNFLPARAAPGDGHWDRQFGAPGTASRNFALRVTDPVQGINLRTYRMREVP